MSLLEQLTPKEQAKVLFKYLELYKQRFPRFDGLTDEEKADFVIDHQDEGKELYQTAIEQTNPYVKILAAQRTDSELGATGRVSTFRTDSGATISTVTRLDSDRYQRGAELAYSNKPILELSRQDCLDIDYYQEHRFGAASQAATKGSTDTMATGGYSKADASSNPSMSRRKDRKLPVMDLPAHDSTQTTTAPMTNSMERRKNAKLPRTC